jgi:hypothetical protein
MRLFVQAYYELLRFELSLRRGNFCALYMRLNEQTLYKPALASDSKLICRAVDLACIWYWKEVLCLHRSAATVSLLRRYGFPAQLVIGAQKVPFQSHAWVELAGEIINDKPYLHDRYAVLDRC